jgi:glycine betaine/proline transport system substrate-binding protein
MADPGWTDIVLATATAEVILSALGHNPSQTLLGLDVGLVSLREGNTDIFQGNSRPVQDEQHKEFFDDGSVEVLRQNLEGAQPDMVAANRHGPGEWEIVGSSEAGMLSQVGRMVPKVEWVIFLDGRCIR